MVFLTNENNPLKRHIGSARENRYRARQRASNTIQQQQQQQQQILLSPDYIRARWIELFHAYNKNNET